ncbi:MAG: methyl-accepting chemotaxis protein [Solibacillus sp.]
MSETSSQISTNVEVITEGTQMAAQIANDSAVAMDESASGIQNIAESTQIIHTDAVATRQLANEGEQSIVSAKEQMESIYISSKLTSELIGKLSKSSTEIQQISKVITDITDQTNLLALNAAIEAARAGEHGKGFAVVADEVRKLAEQSKESAQLIGNLTNEILTETTHVEQSVTEGLARVETGVHVIHEAGSSFSSIVASVEAVTVRMAEVSAVTEEMSAGTEEVSASVETLASNIREAAEQTEAITQQIEEQTASLQEINAIATNLEAKSEQLNATISKFKI